MKHSKKIKLAIKMAKRGARNIFLSASWLNRKAFRQIKELKKQFGPEYGS